MDDGYVALKRRVMQEGLFEHQYGYYALQFVLCFAILIASIGGVAVLESFLLKLVCVVPLTVGVLQASFLSHDLGHRQVFKTAAVNDRVMLVLSVVIGASRGWWIDTHNQHHEHPNDPDLDPNLRVPYLAFSRDQAGQYSGLGRALLRFQAVYFWVLVMLEALAMKVHSVRYLLLTREATYRLAESGLVVMHVTLYGALVVIAEMSWWQAILFVAVQHVLNGLYIGLVFAPNHKGMPLIEETGTDRFAPTQVLTTRNVRDFFLATWLLGGLHLQIEHHLFVNLPRNRLRAARLLVKPFCEERSISYVETGLVESYIQVGRYFRRVAC